MYVLPQAQLGLSASQNFCSLKRRMSGRAVRLPCLKTDLAGGLAKCATTRQRLAEEDAVLPLTTGSEYSSPIAAAETQRRLPIRPPLPASVMHRSRDLCFPKVSHSHAVHTALVGAPARQTAESVSLQSADNNMNATHFHISADRRIETCNTTTRENFQPAQCGTLPAAMIRNQAAGACKFTPYCSSCDEWTPTYGSTFRPHSTTYHAAHRKRHSVTKNAGCCPITGNSLIEEKLTHTGTQQSL